MGSYKSASDEAGMCRFLHQALPAPLSSMACFCFVRPDRAAQGEVVVGRFWPV